LEYIANVLDGNDIDRYTDILDQTNEEGGSKGQSQTKQAHLYERKSKNGILVSTGIFERIESG
jgi:hypothetical protein